jgi:hypothetical protein
MNTPGDGLPLRAPNADEAVILGASSQRALADRLAEEESQRLTPTTNALQDESACRMLLLSEMPKRRFWLTRLITDSEVKLTLRGAGVRTVLRPPIYCLCNPTNCLSIIHGLDNHKLVTYTRRNVVGRAGYNHGVNHSAPQDGSVQAVFFNVDRRIGVCSQSIEKAKWKFRFLHLEARARS